MVNGIRLILALKVAFEDSSKFSGFLSKIVMNMKVDAKLI
jgi:hypothetical protein